MIQESSMPMLNQIRIQISIDASFYQPTLDGFSLTCVVHLKIANNSLRGIEASRVSIQSEIPPHSFGGSRGLVVVV